MKVLMVNSVCGIRSTGRICTDIADVLLSGGDDCRIGYGRESVPERYQKIAIPIGSEKDLLLHGLGSRLFDNTGLYSKAATEKFLTCVDGYKPDLIHLHNIHGYYINIELLFRYLKSRQIPIVWTLHDCWAFTGHCSHFSASGCERWKKGCHHCSLRGEYPASFLLDNSRQNFRKKKAVFSGVENLQIVTPSDWLGDCVRQSFLGDYPIKTIQNGVDCSVFKPTASDVAEKYGLKDKKIILGVASAWTKHKGLDKFFSLAEQLDDSYRVVLLGLTEQQLQTLPDRVIGIRRTNSARELAEIYSAAYVHVSMSKEETMGLTIIESNACGTPVIVFDKTALPEVVTDKTGVVLRSSRTEAVVQTLEQRDFSKEFSPENCIFHAGRFEKEKMYSKYIELYRSMVK